MVADSIRGLPAVTAFESNAPSWHERRSHSREKAIYALDETPPPGNMAILVNAPREGMTELHE